jgi:hydrogenase maturation protease
MNIPHPRILVLGVGNILYADEGLGVRCIELLHATHAFSDNVTLLDGGTMGLLLMGPILDADVLIVADAVLGDGEPGSIYRLTGEDLPRRLDPGKSPHQADLLDTLVYCELLDQRPPTIILGMEPADILSVTCELTPVVARRLPDLARLVLREIEAAGGSGRPVENQALEAG